MAGILDHSFLKSKLARRTLFLFIVCALVPIATFSILSSWKVDQIYFQFQQNELKRSAKGLGLLIFERLQFVERQTKAMYHRIAVENSANVEALESIATNTPQIERTEFFDFASIEKNPLFAGQTDPISLNSNFEKDNKATLFATTENGQASIWIGYPITIREKPQLLAFKVSPVYLWQDLDSYDASKYFSVYTKNGVLLFQSNVFDKISTRGNSNLSNTLHSNSWVLFLGSMHGVNDLVIEAKSESSDISSERQDFQFVARLSTILAVIIASLISIYAIRRSTAPIAKLKQGIEYIEQKKFDFKVDIKSGDEFEKLGNTFNKMTCNLGRHITAMNSLSIIDQLILDRLKIEDLINVVLFHGRNLLQADRIHFCVTKNNGNQSVQFVRYSSDSNLKICDIEIDKSDIEKLNHPKTLSQWNTIRIDRLDDFGINDSRIVYTSVLSQQDKIHAIIIVEFNKSNDESVDEASQNDELVSIASLFVDHVNVAMANCEWEEKLFLQAHYDSLTELPNRYFFTQQLKTAIDQASRANQNIALLFIDVDDFKLVNDTHGHDAGDQFLGALASRLKLAINDAGFIARIGGDEFVLIYTCKTNGKISLLQEVWNIAELLRLNARTPLNTLEGKIQNTISIGIALYPEDAKNPELLLRYADKAMYRAKRDGKNSIRYYSDTKNDAEIKRLALRSSLNAAISNHQFEIYYQPKINLITKEMEGCEALVRWRHPEQGLLLPKMFISDVEELGLIHDLGKLVIHQVLRQKKAWNNSGIEIGRIAVNVSVLQLTDKDFSRDVEVILAAEECDGADLEFEITETAYADDLDAIQSCMNEISKTGIVFSVDDYGTGYSSLALLVKLPIKKVKIDKSFIDDLETKEISRAIVESTIGLAKKMGLSVIAEGVENKAQLSLLRQYQCDVVQGYIFSQPLPATELARFIKEFDRHY